MYNGIADPLFLLCLRIALPIITVNSAPVHFFRQVQRRDYAGRRVLSPRNGDPREARGGT